MNDDRIQRYLSERAEGITLEPADSAAVMKRGNRRRNQKRGGVLAAVAVMGVLGTSLVLQDPSDDQSVDSELASAVVPSDLDWTVVQPDVALGYGSNTTTLADGSIYSISTAPGPMQRGNTSYTPHLYRSTDGLEWAEVSLPAGLSTSSLSGAGDTLYAIGTAPAGGTARNVGIAASTDGGESWTTVTLPEDVAELERRHPGSISVSSPSVAAADATHQVAAFTVSANIDPHDYRDDIPESSGWEITATGVTIYEPADDCVVDTAMAPADPADLTDEDVAAVEAEKLRASADGACRADRKDPVVLASYSFDELGVPAEVQEYIGGETFTYVTDDGATFERVDVPVESTGWSNAQVLRAPDGYRLFVGSSTEESSSTTVLTSVDGRSWTEGAVLDGSLGTAGLLGDRPAVNVWNLTGTSSVQVEQGDGSWAGIDLASAVVPGPGEQVWVGEVAFGPLGLAATLTAGPIDGDGASHAHLVHSTDGSSLSVLDLAPYFEADTYPSGLTVTADAITIRAVHDPDGDATTVEPMDVLVGTPR